jgi:hypothetical protein
VADFVRMYSALEPTPVVISSEFLVLHQ